VPEGIGGGEINVVITGLVPAITTESKSNPSKMAGQLPGHFHLRLWSKPILQPAFNNLVPICARFERIFVLNCHRKHCCLI
jgi:hypothetical protein